MNQVQRLINNILAAYAGLPEAHDIANHHARSVNPKKADEHWRIFGAQIQADAAASRLRRSQQSAPKAPKAPKISKKTPTLAAKTLTSTLDQGKGGLRTAKLKVGRGKNIERLKTSEFINPDILGGGVSDEPFGAYLNIA